MSASAAMDTSPDVSKGSSVDGTLLQACQDQLEDLGWSPSEVEELSAELGADQPKDGGPSDPLASGKILARMFDSLMEDLHIFAYGTDHSIEADAEAKENAEKRRERIWKTLVDEGFAYSSLLAKGPSFLFSRHGRSVALHFIASEVECAKMIAWRRHHQQSKDETDAPRVASSAASSTDAGKPAKQASKKKRGGLDDEDATMVDAGAEHASKRARNSPEHEGSSMAPSPSSEGDGTMEDVLPASGVSYSSVDEELSFEIHMLAHTLKVVLDSSAVKDMLDASKAGSQSVAAMDSVATPAMHTPLITDPSSSAASSAMTLSAASALNLLRSRLESWLNESVERREIATMPPLFQPDQFNPVQLSVLRDVYETLKEDYSLRVRVLRKRIEVTLQSFVWGGKTKSNPQIEAELTRQVSRRMKEFPRTSQVDFYELFSATPLVTHITRMTSREYSLQSKVKLVVIGSVPDRGGRVDASTRMEKEFGMPAFTRRVSSEGSGSSGSGGGGRGGSRGGGRGGGGGGGGSHRGERRGGDGGGGGHGGNSGGRRGGGRGGAGRRGGR